MVKSAESIKGRKLRRSRNVSTLLEESIESAMPSKTTVNVVVDIHNEGENSGQRQQDDKNEIEIKPFSEDSKTSSLSNRSSHRGTRNSSKNFKQSHDNLTMESFDLIEKFQAPKKRNDSFKEKSRHRKQWNTVTNLMNETNVDLKKQPRKRWSKDTGVIRLPETSGDVSPLIDVPHKLPVPAPRTSVQRNEVFHFDNAAFVSENEDEVLRIETDHKRESTRIEMRRMSGHSNFEVMSNGSSRKHRKAVATSERRFIDSDIDRSSRAKSSESRRNSIEELDSSISLEKVIDVRSSSLASDDRASTSGRRSQPEAVRDRSLRKKERRLFKKKGSPGDDEFVSSSTKDANFVVESDTKNRRKKRQKRKQDKEETKEKEEIKYISITIHRADVLETDCVNVKRPMVKVHIVEARTGSYLKNTGKNQEKKTGFLQPMITGKFDFKEKRSMIPVWEEELIFEHNFNAITRREDGNQVVILFEVIDLLSFAEASLSYDKIGSEGCWYKIAWAFLKPVGTNNTLHTDKKVRLQLYRPRRNFKRYGRQKCEVYTWWQSNNRDKYPSSLLVTVTSVPPPKLEPMLYQQLPLNNLFGNTQSDSQKILMRTSDSIGLPRWARLAAQSCKIPNEKMFETKASENGCFYVAFSNDGKYLACVHSEEYNYPIVVYEVEFGKIHVQFRGHKTFVYSLNWSSDDHCLLSASADQTARIWDVRNQIVQHIEMLPHPSYVYCARYSTDNAMIVATGCYDRVARIWMNDRKSMKRELYQELEGHEGFVNSMVFQKNGNLITADSMGSIIFWVIRRNSRIPSKKEWCISRKIKVREIEGVVINTIALHPLESRLLVHSRDNGLRMLDLATGVILQTYKQLNNQRIQLKACISPCGGLILCGGEDSVLNIWNLETGKHMAKYTNGEQSSVRAIVTCVDYHPYDHVLAFSTFGSPTSVRVLRFNKNASGNDVGLNLTEDASQVHGNEVILNILNHPPLQQSKHSGGKVMKKHVSPSRSAIGHTIIQIGDDNHEQPWTKLRRLREIEQNWKERSLDRLHSIIQKIDLMLSKKSMFVEDVADDARTSSMNEHKGSRINIETSASSIFTDDLDVFHKDSTMKNSTTSHNDFLEDNNNARSNSATCFRSQDDRSFDFHNLTTLFEKTNTSGPSCISSPDSVGTYVVEGPDFDENIDGIAVKVLEIDSVRVSGSDNSRVSNVTFIIQNE